MTLTMLLPPLVIIVWLTTLSPALELGECNTALGMQSGDIDDNSLTASSSIDAITVGPTSARIRSEIHGGAWCPRRIISNDIYEYLQIDLRTLKVITLVETQGRFGHGQGQEHTEQYRLEYRREMNGKWFHFKNRRDHEIFQGNTNTYIAEMRDVEPAITARWIRFVPYSVHPKNVCLRVELYGCISTNGITAYSMHQGDQRSNELDFKDWTYDGTISSNNRYLSGGLGQLTDGEEGQSNFRLDPRGRGRKGYEWVGWRNDSFSTGTDNDGPTSLLAGGVPVVEIVFLFDGLRNFSSVRLHCNNMFSRDVRVFSAARIHFMGESSRDGKESVVERTGSKDGIDGPGSSVLIHPYARDSLSEQERSVTIPLHYRIARVIKLELFFDAKWMLVSEIQFESELIKLNEFEVSLTSTSSDQLTGSASVDIGDIKPGSLQHSGIASIREEHDVSSRRGFWNDENQREDDEGDDGEGLQTNRTKFVYTASSTLVPFKDSKQFEASPSDEDYMSIILGVLAIIVLLLSVIIVFVAIRRRKAHQCFSMPFAKKSKKNKAADLTSSCASSVVSAIDPSQTLIYTDCPELHFQRTIHRVPPPPPTCTPYSSKSSERLLYSSPLTQPFILQNPGGRYPAMEQHLEAHLSPQDMGETQNLLQIISGVKEIPQTSLKFVTSLAEGQFGPVHLCELVDPSDESCIFGSDRVMSNTMPHGQRKHSKKKLKTVALKMMRTDAGDQVKSSFQRETVLLSHLQNPNLAQLMGVCRWDQHECLVIEYLKHGNLKHYLKRHSFEGASSANEEKQQNNSLSYSALVYIATQIAAAMKYLESLNIVHRDLAARNCLIGDNCEVKVSDLGVGRSLFSNDYYALSPITPTLPIRWMSWEAVVLKAYSTKSDVWSFAVTLWEVLTFADRQPYLAITDEELMMRYNLCCRGAKGKSTDQWESLQQPAQCPRELYDLMCQCWNREPETRPTFHEIHMFLERKNLGYFPDMSEGENCSIVERDRVFIGGRQGDSNTSAGAMCFDRTISGTVTASRPRRQETAVVYGGPQQISGARVDGVNIVRNSGTLGDSRRKKNGKPGYICRNGSDIRSNDRETAINVMNFYQTRSLLV